ncbi:MAG: glycosyltransferase family 4 protein [Cocleimonas sp.]
MKRVLILYKFLPQYRVEFFEKLRLALLSHDIELDLVYGRLKNQDSKKNDERNLEWASFRENKQIKIGSTNLLWQPSLDKVTKSDLVIVEQANSLLINYLLIPLSKVMRFKLAFWGHGANLQEDPTSIKNKFKYFFLKRPHCWFAYTQGVKKFLMSKGVSTESITVVDNAIDTVSLKNQYDDYSEADLSIIKHDLGIKSNNIAVYCGGIYADKRIEFLIEASQKIKQEVEDFQLLFVGAGPEQYKIEEAVKQYSWIHYIGPKFGLERVPYFKMSKLFLMPGLVGLAVLDTFATQTPMVTTEYPFHSPEIEYLINEKNGVITSNDMESYVKKVVELLKSDEGLASLKSGCLKSSSLYSTENMVENFTSGIVKCLRP